MKSIIIFEKVPAIFNKSTIIFKGLNYISKINPAISSALRMKFSIWAMQAASLPFVGTGRYITSNKKSSKGALKILFAPTDIVPKVSPW